MDQIAHKLVSISRSLARILFAIALVSLFASPALAQMLQPDRGGWEQPQNEQASFDSWPAPLEPLPREVAANDLPSEPDSNTRREIGLASFETPVLVQAPRLAALETVAQPAKKLGQELPPALSQGSSQGLPERLPQKLPQRDATTDPFLTFNRATPQSQLSQPQSNEPDTIDNRPADFSSIGQVFVGADSVLPRNGLDSSIKAMLLLAALSLAPAIVLMTTSYVRVVVVLSLLRQAFGSQQLPPTQVITALSLFLTMLVMAPVWNEVKSEAIDPYSAAESEMTWQAAWDAGVRPVRGFMQKQIQLAGNEESIATFYRYLPETSQQPPSSFDDVPFNVLLPAFMVSELKVAFLLGFQVFLPFLVLDLVVSSVTVSMGMLMLPPNMVSFPLKLILFVMVDGWNLVIGMLLQSFGPFG